MLSRVDHLAVCSPLHTEAIQAAVEQLWGEALGADRVHIVHGL